MPSGQGAGGGPDERGRLWPKAVRTWRDYRQYQRRTERQIPLVILEPRER